MSQERPTVLVVDDEQDNLDLYRRALTGYRVETFDAPEQALVAVRKTPPACMVVDYRMPEMNGVELVKRSRAAGYEGDVLMVTAFAGEEEIDRAAEVNLLFDVMPKPIEVGQLRERIELVVAETRFRKTLEGRRAHPRFEAPVVFDVQVGTTRITVDTLNVCLMGALLEPNPELVTGDDLRLALETDWVTVRSEATVVYANTAGIGIRFVNPTEDFIDAIGEKLTEYRFERD